MIILLACVFASGAPIEAKDKDNFTPLLLAVCYGHAKAVKLLIDKGADISVEDKNDRTAIYLAAEENKLDVLEVHTTRFWFIFSQFSRVYAYVVNADTYTLHINLLRVTQFILSNQGSRQNYYKSLNRKEFSTITCL